jgi:PBSX family phage terminase large subunit
MQLGSLERLLSRKQILSIVDSTRRTLALWSGSVSAGKTIASLIAFLLAVKVAPKSGLIVIVGRTLQTVYQNVIVPLQDPTLFGSLVAAQVNYTPGATKAVILGREVMVIGAHNAEAVGRIQGATIALAYVDEATLLPEVFWNMLVTRLRVAGARLLATMNPASRNHWMRKNWILKADAVDLIHFHFTMLDNPSLQPEYVERMKRSYSGVFYDRFIKGEWTNAEGAVYPMWDPSKHVVPWASMPRMQEIMGIGMDYGTTNATTALMLGVTAEEKPRLILMDEWGYNPADHDKRRLTDSELSRRFRTWLKEDHQPIDDGLRPRFLMLDPAAASMRVQLHQDLRGTGLAPWPADNDVLKGIATIANLLDGDEPRMQVSDRCTGWQSEVTEYRWDEKATAEGDDEVVKENDHYLDGGRYITHSTVGYWQPMLALAA